MPPLAQVAVMGAIVASLLYFLRRRAGARASRGGHFLPGIRDVLAVPSTCCQVGDLVVAVLPARAFTPPA